MKISINQIKELLQRYCCCLLLFKYFQTKKISPESENELTNLENDVNKQLSTTKNDISEQLIIKKFVKKWEKKFWPNFWVYHANNLLRREAAIKIQTMIRRFLGKVYYRRKYLQALLEMNDFWNMKREQRLLEKEKLRIAKETRAKVCLFASVCFFASALFVVSDLL